MTLAFVFNACGLGVLAGSFIKTEKSFNVAGMFGRKSWLPSEEVWFRCMFSLIGLFHYEVFAQWTCTRKPI